METSFKLNSPRSSKNRASLLNEEGRALFPWYPHITMAATEASPRNL